MFDATFLESNWTCIYGQGCPGILTGPAPELELGCCSYGAHFVDKNDVRRVERAAATLTDEEWQFRHRARNGVTKTNRRGERVTRLVDGACIFLNRPGFPTGAGCALHQAALRSRSKPLELKPEVCWQVPIRREDHVAEDGYVTSVISEWERRHWGPGGEEFHWWCTESPQAFVGSRPVWQEMRLELTAMVGPKVYGRLARLFGARARHIGEGVPLPHPAVRRRDHSSTRELR